MALYLQECLPYLKKPFVAFKCLHFHPYCWLNKDGGVPVITRNPKTLFHWYLNFALYVTNYGFVVWRTVEIYLNPASTVVSKFIMATAILIYSPSLIFNVSVVTRKGEYMTFLRSFIGLLRDGNAALFLCICKREQSLSCRNFQALCVGQRRSRKLP